MRNAFSAQIVAPNGQFNASKNSVLQQLDYQVEWQNGQGNVKKFQASAPGVRWRIEPHSYFDAVNRQMDLGLRLDIQPKTLLTDYVSLRAYATHPVYIRLRWVINCIKRALYYRGFTGRASGQYI